MYVNQNTKYAISIKWNYMDFRAMKYVQKQEDDVGCTHTVTFLATALNICDQGHGKGGLCLGWGTSEGAKQKAGPGPLSIFQSFSQMGPILGFVKSCLLN